MAQASNNLGQEERREILENLFNFYLDEHTYDKNYFYKLN